MVTWAEFPLAGAELAAIGQERLGGRSALHSPMDDAVHRRWRAPQATRPGDPSGAEKS